MLFVDVIYEYVESVYVILNLLLTHPKFFFTLEDTAWGFVI